jgi:hypothetical protein
MTKMLSSGYLGLAIIKYVRYMVENSVYTLTKTTIFLLFCSKFQIFYKLVLTFVENLKYRIMKYF